MLKDLAVALEDIKDVGGMNLVHDEFCLIGGLFSIPD